MDEALKAKLAYEQRTPKRKRQRMPQESKLDGLKKWLVLHPKVKAAFYALAILIAVNVQAVYDGTETYQEAVKRTVGAVIVAAVAYLKASNGSQV